MSTAASKAFHTVYPPRVSGKQTVQSAVTSTSATVTALFTGLGADAPQSSKVYTYFEAVAQDVYFRLRNGTAAGGTTSSNGVIVKAGQPGVSFWVDSAVDTHIDHVALGAGVLKWYVASPPFDGVL